MIGFGFGDCLVGGLMYRGKYSIPEGTIKYAIGGCLIGGCLVVLVVASLASKLVA